MKFEMTYNNQDISYIPLAMILMGITVVLANVLIQYPLNFLGLENFLTWGAFLFPMTLAICDLTNRRYGPSLARSVVYVGFISALIISWFLATPRIAIAAGFAFLIGQLLDIYVFNPLRQKAWWIAPTAASIAGTLVDTILFFTIAFAPLFGFLDIWTIGEDKSLGFLVNAFGFEVPLWLSLIIGGFWMKMAVALITVLPLYGAFLAIFAPQVYKTGKFKSN